MLRLSKKSGLYPTCFSIHNVRKVDKYPIAQGGFGEVWRGLIGSSEDHVCLKIMKVYLDSDLERLSKEYLREAILWRQLKHPNVLPFLGIYWLEDSQQVCLLSPWLENSNLVKFLKVAAPEHVDRFALVSRYSGCSRIRQNAHAIPQAHDIATGLSYLHQMTVVHGDLKGVNVVVNELFRACITDFGLSCIADAHVPNLTSSTTRTAGTVRWQAPELLTGSNKVTKESDVYAYACVCYEIYAGCHPFPELTKEGAVILKVIQGELPTRPEGTSKLSDAMWALMKACWSSAPPSRPTADALLGAMAQMEETTFLSPSPNWNQSIFTQAGTGQEGHLSTTFHLNVAPRSAVDSGYSLPRSQSDTLLHQAPLRAAAGRAATAANASYFWYSHANHSLPTLSTLSSQPPHPAFAVPSLPPPPVQPSPHNTPDSSDPLQNVAQRTSSYMRRKINAAPPSTPNIAASPNTLAIRLHDLVKQR
ncbi:hypothetical protein V5O48_004057 [Marasmius crinis-equi]|uniref:Protein kinase domain-containing protein n=1 Tax=Marasmius crinis-equi TaxID=585013 RepID=A0ABR3FR72_9AGAR